MRLAAARPVGVAASLALIALARYRLAAGAADLARDAFVLPVVVAALGRPPRGGVLAALGALMLEAPSLLLRVEGEGLSAPGLEECAFFLVLLGVGALVGATAHEARARHRRYELLLAVQRRVGQAGPLAATLPALTDLVGATVPGGTVALVVRDGERWLASGGRAVVPGSAVAHVLADGGPVFVPDTGGGARPRRSLVVPLVAGGQTTGALAVEVLGDLERGEPAFLAALGLHLGLALEHARLTARQRRFVDELAEQLAAVGRANAAFVATASHELRTPLTSLLGFSELLATRELPPPEARRLAGIVHRESERLVRILDDLLDVTRVAHGPPPAGRAVAAAAVLDEALAIFQGPSARHRLVLAGPAAGARVRIDAEALGRIVRNLVSNAIKYSPAGSAITVAVEARGERVVISVEDEGPGIAAADRARIFEPYYRAPGAASAAPGAGLGLAVVRALVAAHGGAVRIDSAPARGTRVSVELPAVP